MKQEQPNKTTGSTYYNTFRKNKSPNRQEILARMTHAKSYKEENQKGNWKWAGVILAITSGLTAYMSEILVGAVELAGEQMGLSQIFMGVIILAIVGNAAEHTTAIMMAMRNKMDISLNIALGSSLQVAMFVGPVLCLCSYGRSGPPLNLVFTLFEVFAVFIALVIAWMVVQDGETTWMEGFLLCILYLIFAIGFGFLSSQGSKPPQ